MSIFKLSILLVLVLKGASIYLPIKSNKPRCVIVYILRQEETMKVEFDLPIIKDQVQDEHYVIAWKNTQNNQYKFETKANGIFRKQMPLLKNVIYELCVILKSSRPLEFQVNYEAYTEHNIIHEKVVVPENLLKKEDFKNAYIKAAQLDIYIKDYKQMQAKRESTQNVNFDYTNGLSDNLITLSSFELIVVVLAGLYEFYALKNYLQSSQRI